ncbi:hypothetical protein GCM10009001_10810 [Virgibacillus siamensis]|uniref:Uncharacterized protein n=1 Tax=Virgibacillus siamensis TaxID=480071 RepID=A0ABP3QY43_9BACI
MTEIKNLGSFCDTEESGYIINTASTRKISHAFHEVLDASIIFMEKGLDQRRKIHDTSYEKESNNFRSQWYHW